MFSFINIFGKKKVVDKVTESDKKTMIETIHSLKAQISLLEKRKNYIDVQIVNNCEAIKAKLANNNRTSALILVKKNKTLEEEMVKMDSMCLTLEQQIMALESANINSEYFGAIRKGKQVIESANAKTDVDSVEKLMDDIDDQREITRSINELLMQPANGILEDEDLLKELEQYTVAVPKNTQMQFPTAPKTMNIIKQNAVSNEADEEEELKTLIRELAM